MTTLLRPRPPRVLTPLLIGAVGAIPAGGQVFGPEVQALAGGDGVTCVVDADLDGDGDRDLVVTETYGGRLLWIPRTGPVSFGAPVVLDADLPGAWQVLAGDLDGDGDPDLVATASTAGTVTWYRNDHGATSFTREVLTFEAEDATGLVLEDLDLDGDLDVVATAWTHDNLLLIENLGGGQFAEAEVLVLGIDGPWCLASGDLDGDGLPDLLVGSWMQTRVIAVLADGAGGYGPQVVIDQDVAGPSSLEAVDLDGDGDLDVLCTARDDGLVTWYENDGPLDAMTRRVVATAYLPTWSATADLDSDGDPDVFVAAGGDGEVRWHENLGGSFGSGQLLDPDAFGSHHLHVTDLDGDSDPDVVTTSFVDGKVGLHPNLLPTKTPKVDLVDGLHCLDDGSLLVKGSFLAEAAAWVDGVPVSATPVGDDALWLDLQADLPGGLRDLRLANGWGEVDWPGAVRRFPVLDAPTAAPLGGSLSVHLDNGEAGHFALAWSHLRYASPQPFHAAGWYHGLELNGCWIVAAGPFDAADPRHDLALQVTADPAFQGLPIHLQAWTLQAESGIAGFTDVVTVLLE